MSHETDHSHHVRKVVLPSGKTIEVVYFEEQITAPKAPPAPTEDHLRDGDLHVCGSCHGKFVQPLEWSEASSCHWEITLRCPDCGWIGTGVFAQEAVDRFDRELDHGMEALTADLEQVTATNMLEEIERFAAALHADFIVADDF